MGKHFSVPFAINVVSVVLCVAEFQVNTRTGDSQWFSDIAMGSTCNFVVVWTSYRQDGSSGGIYGQRFDANGTAVADEFRINNTTEGNQTEPAVAMDALGNFVAVWHGAQAPGDDWEDIFARRYDSNGQPLADEFRANTRTSSRQTCPAVAMNGDGNFVIVWESFDWPGPGDRAICGQLYNSSGSLVGSEFTANDEAAVCRYPTVAMRADGRFTVVWVKDTTTKSVWKRNFQADGTSPYLSTPVNEAFSFSSLTRAQIAFDAGGNCVIAWDGHPSSYTEDDIYIRRYHWSGAPILEECCINTYQTGAQSDPALAMAADGQFIVVWQSDTESDVTGKDIFGQRFPSQPDNIGSPILLGDQFRINTYVAEDQRHPAVAIGGTGQFTAVWESYGQDGSQYGVFGEFGPEVGSPDIDDSGFVGVGDYALLAREWGATGRLLRGDLIDDDLVDEKDLAVVCEQWLTPRRRCDELDLDGDGSINLKDYAIWSANWSKLGPKLDGDVTTDGIVDMVDLKRLLYYWTCICE